MSSKFFTNNHDRNMFDKFRGIIEQAQISCVRKGISVN